MIAVDDKGTWSSGSPRKRALFFLAAFALTATLAAVFTELLATAAFWMTDGRFISPRTRFAARANTFQQDLVGNRPCDYVDTLFPHPYLTFVHHANPPCGLPYVNGEGLFGPEFPPLRRSDRFVVLLTGGSVAAQFAEPLQHAPTYLESELNAHYRSPSGKPFLVLDGGDGSWKQPQQTILLLLHAHAIDAVVTLDGWNEMGAFATGSRLEMPQGNFAAANPLVTDDFAPVAARWAVREAYRRAAQNPIVSRSNAAYAVVAGAEALLNRVPSRVGARSNTLRSLFAIPPGWSADARWKETVDTYRFYIRAMHAIAGEMQLLDAYFFQPMPAIDKRLTPDERRVVGDLGYKAKYEGLVHDLESLEAEGLPVSGLLDVFASETGTIYSDPVHMVRQSDGSSRGNLLIAQRISAKIAKAWRLQAVDRR